MNFLLTFSDPNRTPRVWHTHRTFDRREDAETCAETFRNVRLETRIFRLKELRAHRNNVTPFRGRPVERTGPSAA